MRKLPGLTEERKEYEGKARGCDMSNFLLVILVDLVLWVGSPFRLEKDSDIVVSVPGVSREAIVSSATGWVCENLDKKMYSIVTDTSLFNGAIPFVLFPKKGHKPYEPLVCCELLALDGKFVIRVSNDYRPNESYASKQIDSLVSRIKMDTSPKKTVKKADKAVVSDYSLNEYDVRAIADYALGFAFTVLCAISLYFLPILVAMVRKTKNVAQVLVINFFLGWTFVGWVVALVMAFSNNVEG